MPKYRKKPPAVEANRFFPDKLSREEMAKLGIKSYVETGDRPGTYNISINNFLSALSIGDWIILSEDGAVIETRTPDEFYANYEELNNG